MILNGSFACNPVVTNPDWIEIARYCPQVTNRQAQRRFNDSEDYDLKSGPWEDYEVHQLLNSYTTHGPSWRIISESTRDKNTGKRRSANACKTKINNIKRNETENRKVVTPVPVSFGDAFSDSTPRTNYYSRSYLPPPIPTFVPTKRLSSESLPELPLLPNLPPMFDFGLPPLQLCGDIFNFK